ncbi:MAG: Clp protease N-terminal domain-containing protein [Chloroflexota bacterium]
MAERFDKFTDRARRALQAALEAAQRFGRNEITAEHVLVGLLADRTSVAAHALAQLGIDLDALRSTAAARTGTDDPPSSQVGLAASAKQAIELAVEEARALDHQYVGTEHLLLGLLRQGANSAAEVLLTGGITLQRTRNAILAVLTAPHASGTLHVQSTTTAPAPADNVELLFAQLETFLGDPTQRRAETEGELLGRLSDQAVDVLGFGVEEARRLGHHYIGTEHILLGLVREPETPIGRLLVDLGMDLTKVRGAVELIIGRGEPGDVGEPPRFTPRARKVILLGLDEAQALGGTATGPEHLLLGIVREGEGIASGVLESLVVNPDRIRSQVLETLNQASPDAPEPPGTRRLSRVARKALLQAQLAARWYYHPQVGTEHLLLGLSRQREGVAAAALMELGVSLARLQEQFEALSHEPSAGSIPDRVEYTSAARMAIDRGTQVATDRGDSRAGTAHLLLGVLSMPEGHPLELLQRLGISADQARQAVEQRLAQEED